MRARYTNRQRVGFLVPLVAMFLSDLVLGLHELMPVIYGCFALVVCLGFWLRRQRSAGRIAIAALAGSVLFFLVTSFGRVDNLEQVRHFSLTMKTATVRDLRNHFPRVAAWIEEGESVEITRAGKSFARLLPAAPAKPRHFKMPDVMARLNETFGATCYSGEDLARGLAASRGDRS